MISPLLLISQLKWNQWKTREEIERLQEERLKQVVSFSKDHVPYYRRYLKGADIRSTEDLRKLPIIRKREIQTKCDQFLNDRFPKGSLAKTSTSGSTGAPVNVYHHSSEAHHGPTLEMHQLTEAGVGPLDLQAHIFYRTPAPRLFQRAGLFRRRYLSMYSSESDNLKSLKKMNPPVLLCHPSYLIPLAHENLVSGAGVSLKKAFTFSEMLSPRARELIEKSFSCEVYDAYGVVETSWVAWECEKGNKHLHSDSLIAEIVDEKGDPVRDGEYGYLVLTTLWKRSMPIIRYFVGDRTALGPQCPCGRGLHTLKPLQGRFDDFIVLESGRLSSARILDVAMRYLPGTLLYQAIQEEPGQLHIKVVPTGGTPGKDVQEKFIKELGSQFTEPIRISLEFTDSLPRGRTGKIRSLISKVKPDLPI